ncbi:hypothetical protein [Winogradskyella sp.]|jgi:hypothetical protein|uniref:hypothetical protein n=1 Tax=Winogradskyella sp. TaxID=1883156 RepID=UPI0025CC28F0|nr:hypothetical protein [Winogradskyella sp.]MCT4629759.1 hypothetical protein [Winogradskyella sp.]
MKSPKGLITPDEAKELNNAYSERHELISKDITKRPDNRSSWYSLEEIESFLAYAKAQAKELGYEMDGIRIYCGAYPEEKEKAGYSTSFIIPTTSDSLGKDGGGSSSDIIGANGLNRGQGGVPPSANYPQ